jgi:hypothetical protein
VSALFAATPSATTFHSLMKELPRYSANEHLFAHYSEQVLLACHLTRIPTTLPCGYRAHSQDDPPLASLTRTDTEIPSLLSHLRTLRETV